jgi:predicted membrane channel-forming protein YqfA (hemolysin III family)
LSASSDRHKERSNIVGLGLGIILIAVGAIMAWAVTVETTGFDINTAGYILLVVGVIASLISLVFWSSWAGPGYFTRREVGDGARRRTTVVEDDAV